MRALVLLALVAVSFASVYKMQLKKNRGPKPKFGNLRSNHPWTVYDYQDFFYTAEIEVGAPPQTLTVIPDTSSHFLWVDGKGCTGACVGQVPFDSSKSSTFAKSETPFLIQYGSGNVTGHEGSDNIGFGGVVVKNTTFGLAEHTDDIKDSAYSGILGLIPYRSSDDFDHNSTIQTSIVYDAYKQGLLEESTFTIFYEKEGNNQNISAGTITLGGFDSENCDSQINYVPIYGNYLYDFKVDSISIKDYKSDSVVAVTDSGTSFLLLYKEIVDGIVAQTGATASPFGGYFIDCSAADSHESLVLSICVNNYEIPLRQLVIDLGEGQCQLAIDLMSHERGLVVLGDPFVRSYCQVHDLTRKHMGFAKVKTQ